MKTRRRGMKTLFVVAGLCVLLAASSVMAQVVGDLTPPSSAPTPRSPSNGDQLDSNSAKFEWDSVSDPSGVTYTIVVFDMTNGITLWNVSGISGNSISLRLYDSAYSWNVTATDGAGNVGPTSADWYCQVIAVDYSPPDTVLTAPNGGEILADGDYFPITWYTLDAITPTPDLKVNIYFSYNFGRNWVQIASLDYNKGAFAWEVPSGINSDGCLIRVTIENEFGMLGADDSDFAFLVFSPDYHPHNSYSDVPYTHFAADQIEAITASGITTGCVADNPASPANEARFCPGATVTRGQMAVFINSFLGQAPTACTGASLL